MRSHFQSFASNDFLTFFQQRTHPTHLQALQRNVHHKARLAAAQTVHPSGSHVRYVRVSVRHQVCAGNAPQTARTGTPVQVRVLPAGVLHQGGTAAARSPAASESVRGTLHRMCANVPHEANACAAYENAHEPTDAHVHCLWV